MVDTNLVHKAQDANGDDAILAYRELVTRHQALMFRAAYLASGSQGAAEHIAEDAFVKAFADLDDLVDPSNLRPWLLKYVTDEALDFRHMTDQQPNLTMQTGKGGDRQQVVIEAMNHVSDFDRILLSYHYTLRLPDAEIASALGISSNSYSGRLAEAQRSLNRQIASLSATQAARSSPPGKTTAPDADTIETAAVDAKESPEDTADGASGTSNDSRDDSSPTPSEGANS